MTAIKAILAPGLFFVSQDADLCTTAEALKKSQFKHSIVLNENNHISGVLTARDLQKAGTPDLEQKVQDFMSANVTTISGDTSLLDLSRKMFAEGSSAFLVVSKSEIKGVISSEDLMTILYYLLDPLPSTATAQAQSPKTYLENMFFKSTAAHYLERPNEFKN